MELHLRIEVDPPEEDPASLDLGVVGAQGLECRERGDGHLAGQKIVLEREQVLTIRGGDFNDDESPFIGDEVVAEVLALGKPKPNSREGR